MKTFKIKLDDEAMEALKTVSAQKGLPEEVLLNKIFALVIKQVLARRATDLSPAEAGRELNVSAYTVCRYFAQGKFPHAYKLNERVMRIPLSDIQTLKDERRLTAA